MGLQRERSKVYSSLSGITKFYHFAPLDGELDKKIFHKNLTLMFLSYILDKNHLLVGEPGWGKTTSAKIISAKFSGLPYDLYDSLEIRGNPQKYEEKIVGRPHYGKLSQGVEDVVWQGTFGLDAIVVDEVNRLPYETQDVILQGIDTGRWNYQNESLFEGKKPTFMTMNEREDGNGLFAALNDRLDIVTEEKFFSTLPVFGFSDAKKKVETDFCKPAFTQGVLDALKSGGFTEFKKKLQTRVLESYLTSEEKKTIREEISKISMDNDAWLFLQSFMAEINYSYQYGCKRATDPTSPHTHDQHYVGIHVRQSFSPRSVNATLEYAKGLVWFLSDKEVGLDHIKFILPHVFAHKARFTEDFENKHGNDTRTDYKALHLAKVLVDEAYKNYTKSVQPAKNFIARIQKKELTGKELKDLKEDDYDHPLTKDLVRQAKEQERTAFYGEGSG